jgi:hypothetical protein
MSSHLKAGVRIMSTCDDGELIVVRSPDRAIEVTIGGHPVALTPEGRGRNGHPLPGHEGDVAVGKRYADPDNAIEVLCLKAGKGSVEVDGVALVMLGAKALPSSD